jgi:hypothetical protein
MHGPAARIGESRINRHHRAIRSRGWIGGQVPGSIHGGDILGPSQSKPETVLNCSSLLRPGPGSTLIARSASGLPVCHVEACRRPNSHEVRCAVRFTSSVGEQSFDRGLIARCWRGRVRKHPSGRHTGLLFLLSV